VLDLIGALTGAGHLIDRGARATPATEPPRIVASVRRLVDATGFRPALSLEQGLAATVQWWRELQARRP
jgi:nucleoside-diphosphate-sugar epimerase